MGLGASFRHPVFYFDKYPQELTENECALLAGVPKALLVTTPGKSYNHTRSKEPCSQAHGGAQDDQSQPVKKAAGSADKRDSARGSPVLHVPYSQ